MIIGIDPGVSGGLVFFKDKDNYEFYTMPEMYDVATFMNIIKNKEKGIVYIEKSQSMPGQSSVAMFKYGMHTGWVIGILQSLGYEIVQVHPATWTKVMHAGIGKVFTGKGSGKRKSLEAVRKLFPNENFLITTRSTKPHDGFIDALLIAYYGYKNEKGLSNDV